jgi:predicted CxxxxCH...CXXCH cytochrome family protein
MRRRHIEACRAGSLLSLFAAGLCAVASCAKARAVAGTTEPCVTWKDQIGPLFADRCQGCHSGAAPAGQYQTDSYAGVLGGGSDATPDAIAGDPTSRLLATLDPTTADEVHRAVSAVFQDVRTWVVTCGLSYAQSSVHPGGILNPASADFHGQLIKDQKYAFGVCQKCHGTDFAGGSSGVSCLTCHDKGPTDCSTCHGDIAASGSHARHLGKGGAVLGKTYGCNECHVVPSTYTDVGHIFLADGSVDPPPAEVTLGATAALTPPGSTRAAAPAYDATTQSCANVYCHGAVLGDTAATNNHPAWSAPGTGQADCGTCHGLPPNHKNGDQCSACHASVVDNDRKIIAPDRHIDGKVDFADTAAGCTGCHGGPAGPAPPRDLTGQTAPTALGVGAHQAHLTGSAHLRGPIACTECHRVPADVSSPDHFGGHGPGDVDIYPGAEVFPADPAVGALASADGATPRWDRASATCSGVYCHGGGNKLGADTVPTIDREPVWTATGGLACGGACHGLPPAFAPHLPTMARTDCASCHPRTVDPAGTIIVSGPPGGETSFHMNGVLDVSP